MTSQQQPRRHRVGLLVLVAVFSLLCLLFDTAAAVPKRDAHIGNSPFVNDALLGDGAAVCLAQSLL